MEYLGDKLSVAQSHMSGWVGNVRRSFHGAFNLLSSSVERGGRGEDGTGDFKRTNSLRSLASRSRESIRRFSLRSQQRLSLRRRTAPNTPTAVQQKQSPSGDEEGKDSPVRDSDSQYGTWETGLRTDDRLIHRKHLCCLNTTIVILSFFVGPLSPPTHLEPQTETLFLQQISRRVFPHDSVCFVSVTEAKPERKDDSDSEETTRGADGGSAVASQPQRVALFPGMDPSALKAQLKKRGESDNQTDGASSSPSQLSRSPKSPFLPRAARVLPPPGGKENGEEDSPQWLKELKSKKRLSQYDNDS
uniref:Trichohyalin-like n=1 Tax=Sparus aurata TaxID=8175 RepID=A0A671U6R1_SPAAU